MWNWFTDLDRSRPTGNGPCKIPHSELIAWQQTNGIQLQQFEVDLIFRLDDIVFKRMSMKMKQHLDGLKRSTAKRQS